MLSVRPSDAGETQVPGFLVLASNSKKYFSDSFISTLQDIVVCGE